MKNMKTLVAMAVVVAVAMIPTLGFSSTDDAEKQTGKDAKYSEKQWKDGVRDVNKGLNQLDDFDESLMKADPKSAQKHLKKVGNHFDKALTHFEKAEVGKKNKGVIDDINDGVAALNKAYNDIDKGDVDSAQSHLDKASDHFNQAAEALQ
jgi:hypothetical protein